MELNLHKYQTMMAYLDQWPYPIQGNFNPILKLNN